MKRIVILISGRGSNMEAIVQRCAAEGWPAQVVAVLANRADAKGLAFAAAHGIATAVVDHRSFATREAFDAALAERIETFAPDLLVLAGFMRILGPIVKQSVVPVRAGDDEEALAARVLATEHVIYPLAVRWFVTDRLRLQAGVVTQTEGASQLLV
jgi:phosphoribosylglycinamide formyltransferase-1